MCTMKGTKQWNWPIAGYGYVHMWIGSLRLGKTIVTGGTISNGRSYPILYFLTAFGRREFV